MDDAVSNSRYRHAKRFEDPQSMRQAIEAYFQSRMTPVLDKDGVAVLDGEGRPYMVQGRPPTYTGLCRALGMASRSMLDYYYQKPRYRQIIADAKARVREYAEEQLYDKNSFQAAKFILLNSGGAAGDAWVDKQEVGIEGGGVFSVRVRVE